MYKSHLAPATDAVDNKIQHDTNDIFDRDGCYPTEDKAGARVARLSRLRENSLRDLRILALFSTDSIILARRCPPGFFMHIGSSAFTCSEPVFCVMPWRALKLPWRPGRQALLRYSNLDASIHRSRHAPSTLCIRHYHDHIADPGEALPRLVRHASLLHNHEQQDGRHANKSITITGLVRSVRKQKKVAFARVADGSTLAHVQAVFHDPTLAKEYVHSKKKVTMKP